MPPSALVDDIEEQAAQLLALLAIEALRAFVGEVIVDAALLAAAPGGAPGQLPGSAEDLGGAQRVMGSRWSWRRRYDGKRSSRCKHQS